MPRATAADAAATARRVLHVATERFIEAGFAAVSIDDVARRAGVTRGAVYHHFDGREGLFRAVVERAQRAVAERIVDAATGTPAEQLRAGSHAFLDAITEASSARLLLVDAPAVLGWSVWRETDAAASGRELHDALSALGTLPAGEVEAMTRLLSGAMNEAALWLIEQPSETARASAHAALDRLLDALVQ